ncbi:MAG: hypothetical protein ACLQUT_07760 [Thermoleophilia bacterium]
MKRRFWFGCKRIGWGLRPVTWQGWALTGLYVVLVIVVVAGAKAHHSVASAAIEFVILTVLYLLVAFLTSDRG